MNRLLLLRRDADEALSLSQKRKRPLLAALDEDCAGFFVNELVIVQESGAPYNLHQ